MFLMKLLWRKWRFDSKSQSRKIAVKMCIMFTKIDPVLEGASVVFSETAIVSVMINEVKTQTTLDILVLV